MTFQEHLTVILAMFHKSEDRNFSALVSLLNDAVEEEVFRLDEMADRLETFGEPESNAEMRQMARELGKAMDDDMADEMEEMFEADLEGGGDEE